VSRGRYHFARVIWPSGRISYDSPLRARGRIQAEEAELCGIRPFTIKIIGRLFKDELRAVSGRRLEGITRERFNAPTHIRKPKKLKAQEPTPGYSTTSPQQRVLPPEAQVTEVERQFQREKQIRADDDNAGPSYWQCDCEGFFFWDPGCGAWHCNHCHTLVA